MVSASCPETPSSCSWCRSQCCPSSGTRRRRTRRCRRSGGRWARPPSPRSPPVSPLSCSCPCPWSTRPALGGFLWSSSRSEKLGPSSKVDLRCLWALKSRGSVFKAGSATVSSTSYRRATPPMCTRIYKYGSVAYFHSNSIHLSRKFGSKFNKKYPISFQLSCSEDQTS